MGDRADALKRVPNFDRARPAHLSTAAGAAFARRRITELRAMLNYTLRGPTKDVLVFLFLAATLPVGACTDSVLPAPSGDEPTDDNSAGEPATGDDDTEPADAGQPSKPVTGKSDAGKSGAAKPALDAAAGTPSPSLDASLVDSDPVGDVSADASTSSDGGFVPPWMTRADLGKGDGKDVVTIGDSWMAGALGGAGIQAALDREGTKYRHYAVTATTLLSGQIPGQYDSAKRANPKISTVIMTGGGNDVMFTAGACSTPEACAEFAGKITMALNTLWTKMANDGVEDVIYVQYADSAGSTPTGSRGASKAVAEICYSGRLSCHTVPTSDIISRSDLADGIHPGAAGNTRIAKRVLELMEQRKIRR
jgi:lysophospholipase L1-like esterase